MIEINNLTFAYGGHPAIFKEFNWQIGRGEAWSVIGPSGCGKTTLLYLLAGLRRPDSGHIAIDGSLITRPRPLTGLVLQDHGLLPWSTVQQNAGLGLAIWNFYGSDGKHAPANANISDSQAARRVERWLKKLGIDNLRDQYPAALSRGQRQRTAIARTLSMDPDLLLLDEAFSALDAPTREDLQKAIATLHKQTGLTFLLVTHDIEAAVLMGEKILVLQAGANQVPRVLENDCAGMAQNPDHLAMHNKCEELRQLLTAEKSSW